MKTQTRSVLVCLELRVALGGPGHQVSGLLPHGGVGGVEAGQDDVSDPGQVYEQQGVVVLVGVVLQVLQEHDTLLLTGAGVELGK